MTDLEQTTDCYVDNLLREAFKCYARSNSSSAPSDFQTKSDSGTTLPSSPEVAGPSATTTAQPDTGESSEPPPGGSDEEDEPPYVSPEDAAAWDAGVNRWGEI